jgi:TolA-binding protein
MKALGHLTVAAVVMSLVGLTGNANAQGVSAGANFTRQGMEAQWRIDAERLAREQAARRSAQETQMRQMQARIRQDAIDAAGGARR